MPMHPDFIKILARFKRQYGEEEGERFFYAWLNKHGLDPDKAYNIQAQLSECIGGICEAFNWAATLFDLYKEDSEARYYKTKALTANVSMNQNDYRDATEMARAAPTLSWRPLNMNHDHSKWLPFPEARVDWAAFEDNSVEAVVRIPNSLRRIQRQIENGDILHVSIEGEPRSGVQTEEGRAPLWYNFTALALLEKDVTLPGDPLTYLEPLYINESMGRVLVESLSNVDEDKEEEKMPKETIWHEYEGLDEAEWTTAFINNLPNSSFAIVETCWRDRRDARHLPYKNAQGTVDLPHLRNALARMDQIKSVCGGSDEAVRERARGRLVPMAKKHLPTSKWAKETLEEGTGNTFIDQCAQCISFKELLPTAVKTPKVDASEQSDGYVITVDGGFGPGVGECQVAKYIVRKNDAACYDGRPRQEPTSADDIERIVEDKEESVEEMINKKEKEDLETELLAARRKHNDEMMSHVTTRGDLVEAQRMIVTKNKEIAIHVAKISRLQTRNEDIDRKLDKALTLSEELKVKNDNLESDRKFTADTLERKEAVVEANRKEISHLKNDLAVTLTKQNNESAKRAEAVQRAQDAVSREAKVLQDNAIISEDLATDRQKVYDLSQRNAVHAREILKLQREKTEAKTKYDKLIEEIRALKRQIGKPPRIKIKT